MKWKTALRFHLSPIRVAKINKTMTTNIDKPEAIGEPSLTVSGFQIGTATVEISAKNFQEIESRSVV